MESSRTAISPQCSSTPDGEQALDLDEVARHLLQVLPRALRPRFPHAPEEWISDAVEDAILDHGRHPGRFDPGREVALERFLLPAAVRNVLNRRESERRRRCREQRYRCEVQRLAASRAPFDAPDAEGGLRRWILQAATNDLERAAILVLLDAPADLAAFGAAMGLRSSPAAEQRKELKRFRDRIVKRLARRSRRLRRIDMSA